MVRLKELRFVQLSVGFVLAIILLPLIEQRLLLKAVTSLFLLNSLLVALSTDAQPRFRVMLWALWSLVVIGGVLDDVSANPAAALVGRCSAIVALCFLLLLCSWRVLRVAFLAERVTLDSIFASVVVYQLIGLCFTAVYTLALIADPTCVANANGKLFADAGGSLLQPTMVYFSFVTMATLGYGDIVPISSVARGIAMTEALVGQFYVAMVVALLIGGFVAQRIEQGERSVSK